MIEEHRAGSRRWPARLAIVVVLVALAAAAGLVATRVTHDDPAKATAVIAPVSASQQATRVTTAPAHFVTLPPGSALPSDATCASQVRPAPEIRPQNAAANATKGHGPPSNPPAPLYARVTGNFTGTTDEIIQWAACKWGIDEDVVRAQAAKESWWTMSAVGDNGESFGIMQVRQPYWGWAFNNGVGDAKTSTAYNLDAALAARRNCFEGNETWLGGTYAKGDLWGCVGLWFSGRWYDAGAQQYITAVKDYLNQRIWQTPDFINFRG
jgi:autotransporter family porin